MDDSGREGLHPPAREGARQDTRLPKVKGTSRASRKSFFSLTALRKTSELSRRIKEAERAVTRLVTEEFADSPDASPTNGNHDHNHGHRAEDSEAQRREGVTQDAGSDDDETDDEEELRSVDALEDQFQDLEEEVATLVADVHDLALYTKLNITGFMKILKVRQRHTAYALRVWLVPFLNASFTET